MAKVAIESKNKDKIENNIIISGIKPSENEETSETYDEEKVKEILEILDIDADCIEKPMRIKTKKTPPGMTTPQPFGLTLT